MSTRWTDTSRSARLPPTKRVKGDARPPECPRNKISVWRLAATRPGCRGSECRLPILFESWVSLINGGAQPRHQLAPPISKACDVSVDEVRCLLGHPGSIRCANADGTPDVDTPRRTPWPWAWTR